MLKKLTKDEVKKAVYMSRELKLPAREIAPEFSVSRSTIQYQTKRYFEDYSIDYSKQETCTHDHLYFHCHDCKLSISEKDPVKMIEHIQRHMNDHPQKVKETIL